MELRDYFRIYTEDEICRGAEQFYAGDLTDIEIKEKYDRGRKITEIKGKWQERSFNANGNGKTEERIGRKIEREGVKHEYCTHGA